MCCSRQNITYSKKYLKAAADCLAFSPLAPFELKDQNTILQ
jgi:hypothetical protein